MLVYRLWMPGMLLFTGIDFGIKNGSASKSSDTPRCCVCANESQFTKNENDRRDQKVASVDKAVDIKLKNSLFTEDRDARRV